MFADGCAAHAAPSSEEASKPGRHGMMNKSAEWRDVGLIRPGGSSSWFVVNTRPHAWFTLVLFGIEVHAEHLPERPTSKNGWCSPVRYDRPSIKVVLEKKQKEQSN